jgi:dihydroxyacetone kinase-like predicted kinase
MKKPLEIVIEHFESAGVTYGDHISHSDINGWIPGGEKDLAGMSSPDIREYINKTTLERLGIVEGLKSYLLEERNMFMLSVHGAGYRIVKPGEQTVEVVNKHMKKITKELKQMERGLTHVNHAMLTSSEKAFNISTAARSKGIALLLGKKKQLLTE